MVQVLGPAHWAQQQFGETELGDKRRTARAVTYAAAAARSPSQSIPQQCNGEWTQTKGAYRLFENEQVTFDNLQEPHRRQTLALAASRSVVISAGVEITTCLPARRRRAARSGMSSSYQGSRLEQATSPR